MEKPVIDLGDLEISLDNQNPRLVQITIYQEDRYYSGKVYLSDLKDAIATLEDLQPPVLEPGDLIV